MRGNDTKKIKLPLLINRSKGKKREYIKGEREKITGRRKEVLVVKTRRELASEGEKGEIKK